MITQIGFVMFVFRALRGFYHRKYTERNRSVFIKQVDKVLTVVVGY